MNKNFIEQSAKNQFCSSTDPQESHVFANLLYDQGFKHVFGRESNKEILINFLNLIIPDRKIVDLEYLNNEQTPAIKEAKNSRYDLTCKTDDGSRIIVELQKRSQWDFIERTLYYVALPIIEQLEIGEHRYNFYPIYSVNILNFELSGVSKNEDVLSIYRLKELYRNTELTDKITMIYIELPKFRKNLSELDSDNLLENFYFCFRNIYKFKECPEELTNEIIKRLFTAAKVAAMDKNEKIKYLNEMTSERDLRNQIEYAIDKAIEQGLEQGIQQGLEQGIQQGIKQGIQQGLEQGMQQGIQRGIEQGKIDTARLLKANGISLEMIITCTGLTLEQIEQL